MPIQGGIPKPRFKDILAPLERTRVLAKQVTAVRESANCTLRGGDSFSQEARGQICPTQARAARSGICELFLG